MIICTPIPIIYFSSFSTCAFHNHFIIVRCAKRDPLRETLFVLVHLFTLCPITIVHLTCVFISLVDDMHIVGFALDVVFFLMITTWLFSIKAFNAAIKMFSLVSTGVGPLYIISSWLFIPNSGFHILGTLMGSRYLLNCLWPRFFVRILGRYLFSLCL